MPTQVRYVASDLDGTIIHPDHRVTPAVQRAVREVADSGVPVGFATGRLRFGATAVYEQLGSPGPHIFHNGAEVRADGRTVRSWPLSPSEIADVFAISVDRNAYGEFYTEDGYYYMQYRPGAEFHWKILGWEPLGAVNDPSQVPGDVLKFTFIGFTKEETTDLETAFTERGLEVGSAGAGGVSWSFVNVTKRGVHKGTALVAAAEYLGTNPTSVLAIGDGDNDLPMLAKAGTAVAMGHASDHVKRNAHLVAPSVLDDGLATALRSLILE